MALSIGELRAFLLEQGFNNAWADLLCLRIDVNVTEWFAESPEYIITDGFLWYHTEESGDFWMPVAVFISKAGIPEFVKSYPTPQAVKDRLKVGGL